MTFKIKYNIEKLYVTNKSKRRSGKLIKKVVFIVAHDTGNDGSTAKNNVMYYESTRNESSASAHIFVDDKVILECIPALTDTPEKAWHVRYEVSTDNNIFGVNANDASIGVELCFSTTGIINNKAAYKRYVWVLAYLCYKFKLNPKKHIIGHETLDKTRRSDPTNALKRIGKTFTDLIEDVVTEYKLCSR